jgi:hypothetical protein
MKFPKLSYDKLIRRGIAITLCAATLALVFGKSFKSRALFDENKAITYQTFASRTTVENSVLFIGTYIIHKDALTDDLYEKAQDSAAESGQNNMYYKSELADGNWFFLDTVDNGIKGISSEGLPESIDTINPLYVTYYVGSDGVLRDAKTMAGLNPFDIPDPYNLANLPELDPIRTQYTMSEGATSISQEDFLSNRNSKDSGNLRSDVYYYQLLSTFFSLNLRDAATDKCDTQLANLNQSYIALKDAGEDEQAAIVYDLMSKVDATRRLLIMERLSEMDDNLLSKLNELSTGTYYTPYGNFKDSSEDKNKDNLPDYLVDLEDSTKGDMSSSFTSNPFVLQMFKQLGIVSNSSGWWTVLEEYEADKEKRAEEANEDNDDYVRDKSPSEYPFVQDAAIIEAIGTAMENCNNSYNTYRAKALVDSDDLLQHFIYDYSTQVIEQTVGTTVGGPIEFLQHVTNIKEDKISDQEGELTYLLNTLIPMASSRYTTSSNAQPGEAYAAATSEGAKKSALEDQKADQEADRAMLQFLIEAMRQRQTAETALEFVNERITITEGLLSALPDGEYRTYSASSVQAHIVWLKEEAQKIIDSDESLRSKLAELLARKNALQDKRDGCLDNNDLAGAKKYDALIAAVDQDIAREIAGGASGSQDNLADKLVDKALSKLADDANADLSGIADALAELGEDDKLDALADKAEASGAGADTLAGISDAKNKGNGNGVDSDALLAQLEALFGKSLDEMDEDELAVAGATCSRLSRSGITPADSLTQIIVGKLVDKNNRFTYSQYTENTSTEYISMETLSNCTDFRYFYDDSKAIATMTKGSIVYIFKRGSDEMYKQDTSSDGEPLTEKVAYQGVVFLDEDDTQNYFSCEAEYCNKTKYAICLTAPKQAAVKDYTERLEEFFKEN